MRRNGCDPLTQHEPPSLAQALYAQLEADRAQHLRCQRGEHDMLATASPGVVVCSKHVSGVQWQARYHRTVEARTPQTKEGQQHEPR